MIALPAADTALSPFTGWTRAHWERVADTILDGAARHASPTGSLIRYPGVPGGLGRDIDHLEGFTRTFMLASFRIAGDPARTQSLARRYARGIAAGVDPTHPERWVRIEEHAQAKVEAAALALGLHLTRDTVWAQLDDRARTQTIDYLSAFMGEPYPPNNWAWFRIMVSFFLESVGGPFSASDRDEDFALLDGFDLPGGWTSDGVGRDFDHYCGWALPFYPIVWAQLVQDDARYAQRVARYTERLDDYLDDALHLIGADGAPLLQGRSLTYRFATAAPAWAAAFHGRSRHDPGLLRRAASGQIKHFVERGAPDTDGVLSLGWHHPWRAIAQNYSGLGSPYWAAKGMLGLALPASHPAWTAPEQPLPIDRGAFARALSAPGWLAMGTTDGIVRIVNHGTDHRAEGTDHPDAPLYAKFGYSTATAPVLTDPGTSWPVDGTVALVRDGLPSHRSGFTVGNTRALDTQTLLGWSTSTAHWPIGYEAGPDHGVGTHHGATMHGPRIDTVSVTHGAWEVRLIRVHADAPLQPGDTLRVGGWALTGDMIPFTDGTTPSDEAPHAAWARTERLATGVVALGDDTLGDGGDPHSSGVLLLDDATPLAGRTAVPWLETTPDAGAWRAFGIHLGAPTEATTAPVISTHHEQRHIAWPDGHVTRLPIDPLLSRSGATP
ncbi:DUF2264 domain-containing protein [Microbacterium esteraromaticum]|uniref:DUF2264 domain-containing protein n=1 Tax=Microbacterium esteraromaticum TaxID=57043 RepID=UPI001CD6DCB2|nr:DUF2264 domain-containing protein [Microbacterium esteraromaticum]MCA1308091.1 DUF2264 domain-containing protein [Microbacterium esteraromaticum]